jgi:hypothetical protein
MWDLEDRRLYRHFHTFSVPAVWTWGSAEDGVRRDLVRQAAAEGLPPERPSVSAWALRICVHYRSGQSFDVDNVPKLIVDAFSMTQLRRDGSRFTGVGLYEDDTVEEVAAVQVAGVVTKEEPRTEVRIFGRLPAAGPAGELRHGSP